MARRWLSGAARLKSQSCRFDAIALPCWRVISDSHIKMTRCLAYPDVLHANQPQLDSMSASVRRADNTAFLWLSGHHKLCAIDWHCQTISASGRLLT